MTMSQTRSSGGGKQGFASMDQEKQRSIASKGGQSVPAAKRSFAQDPSLAAEAGRKGGQAVKAADRSFSRDRSLAAQAGRKGGQATHSKTGRSASEPAAGEA
ncbi:general stress protein [Pseudoroseomonas cervicalis]|uniref:general stress protein n=1 Tax=Teichococcus cervicalis TaxID=204525 RepID=UPI0027D8C5C3|nr:KGG domain-containing protein [Pseudoroseomonas cervicalis]